jgi:hypothetical protein
MTRLVYTLHANAEAEPFASIPVSLNGYSVSVAQAVRELSGRVPGPWLSKNLHRKGCCYVACRKTGTLETAGGFIIRRTVL